MVADPAFKGSRIQDAFRQLCGNCGLDLKRHRGFRLAAAEVPDDFRGPAMPPLAKRISAGGWIDARAIGAAAAGLRANPAKWADRGSPQDVLQELKCLWHVLVHFGAAAE